MTIYEYILEDAGAGFTCPPWIDNGGYWQKGDKLILSVNLFFQKIRF